MTAASKTSQEDKKPDPKPHVVEVMDEVEYPGAAGQLAQTAHSSFYLIGDKRKKALEGLRERAFDQLRRGNFREALLALVGYVELFTGQTEMDAGRKEEGHSTVGLFVDQLWEILEKKNMPRGTIGSIAKQLSELEELEQAERFEIVESVLSRIEERQADFAEKDEIVAMPLDIEDMIRTGKYPAAIGDMIILIGEEAESERSVWVKTVYPLVKQLGDSLEQRGLKVDEIADAWEEVKDTLLGSSHDESEEISASDVIEQLETLSLAIMDIGSQRTRDEIRELLSAEHSHETDIQFAIQAMIDLMQFLGTADPELIQSRSQELMQDLCEALEASGFKNGEVGQIDKAYKKAVEASRKQTGHVRADAHDALQGFLAVQKKFLEAMGSSK